jgi:hypothetical protein
MTKLEDLIKFSEENPKLVQIRTDDKGFRTFKYTRKAFFDGFKNPELENLRGLVVDKNNELVTLPFPKMYNYRVEPQAPEIGLDELVFHVKKINGFMCAFSKYENEWLLSTTGTTNSKYAGYAKEMLLPHIDNFLRQYSLEAYVDEYTFLVEIVHKEDPHIIEEVPDAYFLGLRKKDLEAPFSSAILQQFYEAKEYSLVPLSKVLEEVAKVKHEGFVIYAEDGRYTKIKSPYYLFFKYMARTKSLHDWKNKVNNIFINHNNDEFKQSIIKYMSELNMRDFLELPEQDRLKELRKYSFAGLED